MKSGFDPEQPPVSGISAGFAVLPRARLADYQSACMMINERISFVLYFVLPPSVMAFGRSDGDDDVKEKVLLVVGDE